MSIATKNINAEKIQGDLAISSVSATTYLGLPLDIYVTGGTYNSGTAIFTNNTGGTFNVVGFSTGGGEFTGGTVTGPTIFVNGLSANTFSATTYLGLPLDIYLTGGTYSNGVTTFTNNTGGTFNVTGFSTGYTLTNSEIISVLGYVPLSAYTDVFVTGGTYNPSLSAITFINNTGGTFSVSGINSGGTVIVSGDFLPLSGGTVTGPTIFTNGLSANTFSATTYLGLPLDVYVTGGTYDSISGITTFINNTGGTFSIGGYLTTNDFIDTYVTGFTYNDTNQFTIKQNEGQPDLNVSFNTVTGLTTDYFDFNTGATVNQAVTRLRWNDEDGTLDLGLKGGNVTLQIGQEEVIRVVNKTGVNLLESNYQVVRVRTASEGGAQGQRLAVVLAQADTKANHSSVLGLITENIDDNQEGFITTFGYVRNIDTTGNLQGETWIDGDVLWLSETVAGELTNIEPQNHPVQIGYVVYAHQNNGKIFVKVDEGVDELSELHDVNVTGATDGQVLTYSAASQTWVPTTLSGSSSSGVDVFVTGGTYNSSTGEVLFTNNTGGTFTVTGITSGSGGGIPSSVVGTFRMYRGTQGFEIIPSADRLWIAGNTDNRVDIYEASTGYYIGGFLVTGAFGVIYVSSLNEVWITSSSSATIQRYNPITFVSLGSFTSGGNGGLGYVEVSSTKLYICNVNSNSVSDIDPSTLTVTATITAASMGMSSCNDIAYVDNPSSNHHQYLAVVSTAVSEFAAIDTTSNTVAILGTNAGGTIATPYSICYNPVNDRYYISSVTFELGIFEPDSTTTIVRENFLISRFARGMTCDITTGKVYVTSLLATSVIIVPVTVQCFNTSGIEWSTVTLSANVNAGAFDSRIRLDTVNGFLYVNGNTAATTPQAITKIKI